jgi:hypothetical protein
MGRAVHIAVAIALAFGLGASGWDFCPCCAPPPDKAQASAHACCASHGPRLSAARSSCACVAEHPDTALVEQAQAIPALAASASAHAGVDLAATHAALAWRVASVFVAPSPPSTILRI